MSHPLLLSVLLLCTYNGLAQAVVNDNIHQRIRLSIDGIAINSSTNEAGIQEDCIDKNLTRKCLIYHNDQWFSLVPTFAGPMYIKIQSQKCRDGKGVQLVVLEGDPCKTSSYKLKKCVDFTDQADFFVILDSLTVGQEYLINVDGFLGDFCNFDISVSSQPEGLPIQVSIPIGETLRHVQQDSVVHLQWSVDPAFLPELKNFIIYRKEAREVKSHLLSAPAVLNAFGSAAQEYSIIDTLHKRGDYNYSVFMHLTNGVALLNKVKIQFRDVAFPQVRHSSTKQVEFFLKEKGVVKIGILSGDRKLLYSFRQNGEAGKNVVTVDFAPLIDKGFKTFIITLKNKHIDEGRSVSFQ